MAILIPNLMEHIEDSDLIRRIRSGDQRAFAMLVHRHTRAVYTRIARSVWSPHDVEDLVQTVFLAVYRNVHRLRDPNRFQAWLHALVRNTVYSWQRRRTVQLRLEDALQSGPGVPDPPPEGVCLAIRSALEALSLEHRQVIAHHYFKGYSYAETAGLLDLTVETVRGRLKRARHRLKQELQTMTDVQAQTFELDRNDINAFNQFGRLASNDPKRPILHGICLDVGGRLIVTDGHRLLIRTSKNLQSLAAPVIIGPWGDTHIPDADRATLTINETTAVIRIPKRPEITLSIIEGPYVKYEQVIPQETPLFRLTIAPELLLNALELMEPNLDARHPIPPSTPWQYTPRIDLHISAASQTLALYTARDMGYNRPDPDGKLKSFAPGDAEVPPGGPIDWTFQTAVPICIDNDPAQDFFRVAANFTYIRDILSALEIPHSDHLTLTFRSAERAIMFHPSAHDDWLALLMPLRLEPCKTTA